VLVCVVFSCVFVVCVSLWRACRVESECGEAVLSYAGRGGGRRDPEHTKHNIHRWVGVSKGIVCSVLQYTAVCCSVLQCLAVLQEDCNVLQWIVVCCSGSIGVAGCCSVLQL